MANVIIMTIDNGIILQFCTTFSNKGHRMILVKSVIVFVIDNYYHTHMWLTFVLEGETRKEKNCVCFGQIVCLELD